MRRTTLRLTLAAPLIVGLLLTACDAEEPNDDPQADATPLTPELAAGYVEDTVEIVINPYKITCHTPDDDTACMAGTTDGGDRQTFTGPIWGFEYEWGHRTTLTINVVRMPDEFGTVDGSILEYEVVSQIDDQLDTGSTFELDASVFVLEPDASEGILRDQTPVTCAPELCDAIRAAADALHPPKVQVRFGDEQPLPLVAVELLED